MDTELKNIHLKRGLLFQDFALIEMAMNKLICLYFFEKPTNEKFIFELLEDEYFSFQLRKKIFKLAYNEKYPKFKFPWKNLNELQHLRNISAHSRMNEKILKKDSDKTTTNKIFYLYNKDEKDVILLHEEFKKHLDIVIEALNKIKTDIGIEFHPEPPVITK